MKKKDIQNNLNQYIDTLLENQSIANVEELKNFVTRKDYYFLLLSVLKIIKENRFATNTTIRLKLLEQSGLKELVKELIYKTEITPGIAMEYGTKLSRDIITCGDSQEYTLKNGIIVPEEKVMNYDTIFDLASTSKLFTCLAVYKCADLGFIDLYQPVSFYAPEFINLNEVTIHELLTFSKKIITSKRIDTAKSPQEAKEILQNAFIDSNQIIYNGYTDIGAMVLKFVVEHATKLSFTDFVNEVIIKPAKLENTFLNVPQEKIERCANENFSTIIKPDGSAFTRFDNPPGTVHDPKANAIGHNLNIAAGHAGYFSTVPDMIKLGDALLEEKIISQESLLKISDNAVGKKIIDENGNRKYNWYYGSLVYLKQPNKTNLSVYTPLSGKSFMSPGFAGSTFYLDPLNKISLFIGANRLHNRIYQIPKELKGNIRIDENGKSTYELPNHEEKIVSMTFTRDKEKIIKKALDLAIQYQFLELLTNQEKELHLIREI